MPGGLGRSTGEQAARLHEHLEHQLTTFHALDRADASICETIRSMGRSHFFRQGWSFDVLPERHDGLDGVELTWTRDGEGERATEYHYGVSVDAFRDLVGPDCMVSVTTVRYWLDGMLLDVSMVPAWRSASAPAAEASARPVQLAA